LLADTFGTTTNDQGYKVLNPKIGAIYGDSITLERAEAIFDRLEAKGFASTNVVLGIGSFTYQYNTRDTFGFAMKATYVEIKPPCDCTFEERVDQCQLDCIIGREIFKDPITDDGTKKSAKGLINVQDAGGVIRAMDGCTWQQEDTGLLQTIYLNGNAENITSLTEVRQALA